MRRHRLASGLRWSMRPRHDGADGNPAPGGAPLQGTGRCACRPGAGASVLTTVRAAALGAMLIAAAPGQAAPPGPAEACASPLARGSSAHAFAAAAARVAPATVNVIVIRARRDPMDDLESFDFFHELAGVPLPGGAAERAVVSQERSTSSGFIIGGDGQVLTSAHALFDAQQAWVVTADGRRFQAAVLGFDRGSDVGLLKIDARGLPVARLAAAAQLCPGDWVAALGAPFGFQHSVTVGAVSAYPRFLPGGAGLPLIQSDVVLNPGSSGGPLFDADGLVVGMNSMIYSESGIYVGVSFSLPVERAMRIVEELRSGGVGRGHVGLRTQPVSAELAQAFGLSAPRGALVTTVVPGQPAEAAGLRSGDIILSVNGAAFSTSLELEDSIGGLRPGASVALQVWRHKSLQDLTVQIGRVPRDAAPVAIAPATSESRLGLHLASGKAAPGVSPGVWVESSSGSALLAGIEPGDRITGLNGAAVANPGDFDAALEAAGSAQVVAVLVARGTLSLYIPVVRLRESPAAARTAR